MLSSRLINKLSGFLLIIICSLIGSMFVPEKTYAAANQTTIIMSNNIKSTYDIGEHVTFTIGVSSTDGSYLTKAWCGFGYNQSTMKVVSETDTEDHVWATSDTPTKWLYKEIEFEMTANGKCYFIAGAYSGDGQIVGYRADGSRMELPRASVVYKIGTGIYTKTSDCNLESLIVRDADTGEEIAFNRSFDKNITEYNGAAGYPHLNKLSIEATPENSNDHVELPEDLTLKSGMNDIPISVVAVDGDKKDYVLHIEKPAVPVTVENIKVAADNGNEVNYLFNQDTLSYELTAPNTVQSLSFEAVGLGEGCTVTYPSITTLEPGYNIFYVTIQSEGETKKYEYYVQKELSDLSLSSLVLEGSDETVLDFDTPFAPDRVLYEASVTADVSKVKVAYTLGNPSDSVKETESVRELVSGINYITVTVTDGTNEKVYTVKVNREAYETVEASEPDEEQDTRNLKEFTSYKFKDLLPLAIIAGIAFIAILAVVLIKLKKLGADYKSSAEAESDKAERERKKRLKELEKQRKKKT